MRCLLCGKRLPLLRKLQDAEFCSEEHKQLFLHQHEELALARLIDCQQQGHLGSPLEDSSHPVGQGEFKPAHAGLLEESLPWQKPTSRRHCPDDLDPVASALAACLPVYERARRRWTLEVGDQVEMPHWPGAHAGVLERRGNLEDFLLLSPKPVWSVATVSGSASNGWTLPDPPVAGTVRRAAEWTLQTISALWEHILPEELVFSCFPNLPSARLSLIAIPGTGPEVREFQPARLVEFPPAWMTPMRMAQRLAPAAFSDCLRSLLLTCCPVPLRVSGAGLLAGGPILPLTLREALGPLQLMLIASMPLEICGHCVRPGMRVPTSTRLRDCVKAAIAVPLAMDGTDIRDDAIAPEPVEAFLVPPRSLSISGISFDPPHPDLSAMSLPLHQSIAAHPAAPSYQPVATPCARPKPRRLSARPASDFVPGIAGNLPVSAPQARPHACRLRRDGRPQSEQQGATPSAPPSGLRRRPNRGLDACAKRQMRLSLERSIAHNFDHRPLSVLHYEESKLGIQIREARIAAIPDWGLSAISEVQGTLWERFRTQHAGSWPVIVKGLRGAGIMMALLLAAIAGWPGGSTNRAMASPTTDDSNVFGRLQQGILKRAAISLTDDFRAGLAEWEGEGEWAKNWAYDAAGFVRVGSFALYSPTLPLIDYRMEFLGQIEKRSLAWALRARDAKNYYAVKLSVVESGPVPEVAIIRYPVIDGVAGKAVSRPLPFQVRQDTLYRVLNEVRGNNFVVSIQGQIVDSWSTDALPSGGVGFFSTRGDQARVRWVGVWHQYDTLGRLCAFLAPNSLPGKERGAQP